MEETLSKSIASLCNEIKKPLSPSNQQDILHSLTLVSLNLGNYEEALQTLKDMENNGDLQDPFGHAQLKAIGHMWLGLRIMQQAVLDHPNYRNHPVIMTNLQETWADLEAGFRELLPEKWPQRFSDLGIQF